MASRAFRREPAQRAMEAPGGTRLSAGERSEGRLPEGGGSGKEQTEEATWQGW